MLFRHLLSIALLPFMMTVVVPWWILGSTTGTAPHLVAGSAVETAGRVAGIVVFLAGLALFTWCVALFARVGKGTLAPWDPTTQLVAVGPYRRIRNPMISAVAAILAGEALFFRSPPLALWLAGFVAINHLHFLLVEEPGLARRFGDSYLRYKASVPRWVPRLAGRDREPR